MMSLLDLVVTPETAVAHLAGALAVKCWVALCHAGDWRWMVDGRPFPLVFQLRLFRQTTMGAGTMSSTADGPRPPGRSSRTHRLTDRRLTRLPEGSHRARHCPASSDVPTTTTAARSHRAISEGSELAGLPPTWYSTCGRRSASAGVKSTKSIKSARSLQVARR